jgi:hypothetical protein
MTVDDFHATIEFDTDLDLDLLRGEILGLNGGPYFHDRNPIKNWPSRPRHKARASTPWRKRHCGFGWPHDLMRSPVISRF